MSATPLVSVVLSVYNGGNYLRQSIESILNQSFVDFELIIIDDGSTDDSKKTIQSYKDSRIVFISRSNKGLPASLNEGITKARGEFIARQDDDDISDKLRLEKEVQYLQENPDIALVGSFARLVNADGKSAGVYTSPYFSKDLHKRLYLGNTLVHGSIMVRKNALPQPAYTSSYGPTEDYVLWGKLVQGAAIATLPEYLYTYKVNEGGISLFNSREDVSMVHAVQADLWATTVFPPDRILGIVKRGRRYRRGPEGELVYAQFLGDQRELVAILRRHKKYTLALTIFFALILLHPRSAVSLLLANIRKH